MCEITDWIVWILLVLCGILDWKKREMPVLLLGIMSFTVVICLFCCGWEPVFSKIVGGLMGIMFFLISKLTNEAIGYGDSWLILLLGVYLGSYKALQVLFVAAVISGVCSLFCLWIHGWNRNLKIPFVPFMTLAYLGVMFL